MKHPIRIVLADDHPTFREGVKSAIELVDDIILVGEACNGKIAIELVERFTPDILLLDMQMPELSGVEVLKELRRQKHKTKILVLSAFQDEEYVFEILDIGASGYLLKKEPLLTIIEGIRGVFKGKGWWFSNEIKEKINKKKELHKKLPISKREVHVLSLLAVGYTNYTISQELGISENTVKNHIANIYPKIEVESRVEATIWAWKNGIVTA